MKRLAFVKCGNGFKKLLYLKTGKHGGMTEKQDIELKRELNKNGKYEALEITYIDDMVDEVEAMLYKKVI